MQRLCSKQRTTPLAIALSFTLAACGGSSVRHVSDDGNTAPSACNDVRARVAVELGSIQRCEVDSECGQVLEGTSCGCSHELVARLDADPSDFRELTGTVIGGERCTDYGGACDCPETDGFSCEAGRCAWHYVHDPVTCTPAPIGSVCVVGSRTDAGTELVAGKPLTLASRPSGCYSSSCTELVSSSCAASPSGNDFYVTASICLGQEPDPNVGCSDDCGGGPNVHCATEYLFTEGTHTVRLEREFPLSVTFTVPSIVTDDSLCAVLEP